MRKLAFSFVAVLLLTTSCSKQPEKTIHQKLFSMYPQYIVRKAFETGNNLFIYSFDISEIKKNQKFDALSPLKSAHQLALVSAWEFPKESTYKCENPLEFEGFSACLYHNMQVFTPALDYADLMKKNGAIAEDTTNGVIYSIKPVNKDETQNITKSSSNNFSVVYTKSPKQTSQNASTLIATDADKSITDFESVQMCLKELEGFPAITLAFLAESFAIKSDYKSIISQVKSPTQLIGMQTVFKRWGRNEFISNAAFGSKWANGVETVKAVFVYKNIEKAYEDFETLSRDITQIPSLFTGDSWYKRINATIPLVNIKDSIITIEFDMDIKNDNFQLPLLLRNIEKTGDWGWLWLK
jgi:hypothetical protein